jgi:hypothetical protein
MVENYDGQGKSLEEETHGSMTVIALMAGAVLFWVAVIAVVIAL